MAGPFEKASGWIYGTVLLSDPLCETSNIEVTRRILTTKYLITIIHKRGFAWEAGEYGVIGKGDGRGRYRKYLPDEARA